MQLFLVANKKSNSCIEFPPTCGLHSEDGTRIVSPVLANDTDDMPLVDVVSCPGVDWPIARGTAHQSK